MTTSTTADRLPSGRRSRATRSREDVARHQRDRMLDAMTACVAQSGYEVVTVASVISRAGVSRATFYQQFDDRRDCFLAAFDRAVDLLLTELERHVSAVGTADIVVPALVGSYLDLLVDNESLARVLLVEVSTLGVTGVLRRAASQQRISARLAEVVGARSEEETFACDAFVAAVGSLVTVALAHDDLAGIRALNGPLEHLASKLFSWS